MKKLLIVSTIVLGTLASVGTASAHDNITQGSYSGWAHDALASGGN